MIRREPTIHNPALTVTCPQCGCVPGAPCLDSRGSRLTEGRVHRRRTAEYNRRAAAKATR
ncbi:hypothetical protein G3I39_24930 [Streptomyces fulvissimus]|uniref:DNA-binding phage zinc finger domain-containing protein n=1 Tax=Streptomyces microflavus TaxID=1919 RepID=A0A6N9VC32_STRMI|nr:hypothetical protein [Streptomyces microflavus]NEB70273.1 hypothetical protein [Streptomyces microflavus]